MGIFHPAGGGRSKKSIVPSRGTAAALYAVLESHARKTGLTRLYTEASEAARRFFLKRGFVVTQRRDFSLRGVMIHNYAMEKRLS